MYRAIRISTLLPRRLLSGQSSAPVTGVRTNHVFDQQNLFKYLASQGLDGFNLPDQITVKQFSHGQVRCFYLCTTCKMFAV